MTINRSDVPVDAAQPDNPVLTLAVPTFNRRRYLSDLLDDINAQEYDTRRVEILVCDNASDFDVAAVVAASLNNKPYRYSRNERNVGWSLNFIKCIREARGTHVWLVGDDERLLPGAIRRVVEAVDSNSQVGLFVLSAENWDTGLPEQTEFRNYREFIGHSIELDPFYCLAHTLISTNVFRKDHFNLEFARKKIGTDYCQMYGLMASLGDSPVLVFEKAWPLVHVREARAPFAELVTRLVEKQVGYLKYVGRKYRKPKLVRYAAQFLWSARRYAINSRISALTFPIKEAFKRRWPRYFRILKKTLVSLRPK